MEYLLAVDIQKEFAKDAQGKKIYKRCLDFIRQSANQYRIVAPVYQNKDNPNMGRLLKWREMRDVEPLEFMPDFAITHSGYAIKEYPTFLYSDMVHVIGFDTDACVLSACFDLFNLGVQFDIYSDMVWSSGGKKMHEAGLLVMKRQFGAALTTSMF